ncbi:hypothetical protein RI129_002446 [Pyrocoelia pectoralis]|uniref:Double jelly roll-like domain-containing protein n=1 Tax=Pyrocoelia pectoralis TaxID=417401 RepID=A0AAN7VPM0_9COLE
MNILDVNEKVFTDNSIINYEYHTYQPYTNRFVNNDEIRIPIEEDMCTLPSQSHLYIEGKLTRQDGTASLTAKFVNNGIAFLFSEIRYEINGIVVDSTSKVGLSSTMKALVSLTPNDSARYQNSGWFPTANNATANATGRFNVCIPLQMLLGFAEDYRKVVLNIRQELVLIRSNTDQDAVISPNADEALKHTWVIKTATSLETPRYLIIGFQTDRDGKVDQDASKFDHCDIKNVRVFLNTERYPYDNLNINYGNNRYATLYEMYAKFQSSYYDTENRPLFTPQQFKESAPLIVVDCSNQKEGLNSKSVVLRVEFETNSNIANNTTAYCLILHDRVFTYNALSKVVRQL